MRSRFTEPQEPPNDLAPSGLTTPRAAAVAGVAFAVLFVASVLIIRSFVEAPSTGSLSGVADVLGDYVSVASAYLVPFSGIAFLWFIGVVRDRIGVYEDRFFATVFLGSGLVFVAILFSAAGVAAGALTLTQPTPAMLDLGKSIARGMFYLYGARSAGVFTIVTSMIVLRTGALPRWAAFTGFVIGLVLLLSVQSFELVILLFPAWVLLLSLVILRAGASGPESEHVATHPPENTCAGQSLRCRAHRYLDLSTPHWISRHHQRHDGDDHAAKNDRSARCWHRSCSRRPLRPP